jgi:hypothetical protein
MPRFELKFNDTADWAEHDWLVLMNGRVVAGFAGSNAATRFIENEEALVRSIAAKARLAKAFGRDVRKHI